MKFSIIKTVESVQKMINKKVNFYMIYVFVPNRIQFILIVTLTYLYRKSKNQKIKF